MEIARARRGVLLAGLALVCALRPGTGGAFAAGPAAAEGAPSLAVAWELEIPDTSAPYLVGAPDGFLVATRQGRLALHGAGDGQRRWESALGEPIGGPPVAAGGLLVVPLASGALAVVSAGTGQVQSRIAGPQGAILLSASESGIAVARGVDSTLSLLDAESGALLWTTSLPSVPSAPAARCGETLLVGTREGSLSAVAAAGGKLLWTRSVGGPITTQPLCEDRRAWVGSADNRLHALKLRKRGSRRLWEYTTGGDIEGTPILSGDRVIFLSYDTYLYAVRPGGGHLAWKVRLARRPRSGSLLVGDRLFVAPLNAEKLETFRLPEGAPGASYALPEGRERFVTPPQQAGGLVAIGAARYGEESSRVIALVGGTPAAAPPGDAASR